MAILGRGALATFLLAVNSRGGVDGNAFAFQLPPPSPAAHWRVPSALQRTSPPPNAPPALGASSPRRRRSGGSRGSCGGSSGTALRGKLWDKLGIDPDPPGEHRWYLLNCIAGMELELLRQVRRAASELPPDVRMKDVVKFVVPTERKLRSHGPRNVVDVKALYPGYVFCLIRLCPEVYEPLQRCPLTRSWMGTVHMKGMRKLPVIPVALGDDEVAKFKGLEEETEAMYERYGSDYDGSGDAGEDLLAQYAGYEVDGMIKVLAGKHRGEDGVIRRLKDGKICVRLYTYGTSFDEWYSPEQIRPMTDAEVLKGFTGPDGPITQRDYEVSIGRRPADYGRRGAVGEGPGRGSLRNQLMGSLSGGPKRRMRRQDRQGRGERGGSKDLFGRSREEAAQEEKNWREYREQQRREQKEGTWGLRGDKPWMYEDTQDVTGQDDLAEQEDDRRRMRARRGERAWQSAGPSARSGRPGRTGRRAADDRRGNRAEGVERALEGDIDWTDFAAPSDEKGGRGADGGDDDFFASLMSELSDTLDSSDSPSRAPSARGGGAKSEPSAPARRQQQQIREQDEDDFFASLMSDLSDSDGGPPSTSSSSSAAAATSGGAGGGGGSDEDDFFAGLEADLSETLGAPSPPSSSFDGGDDYGVGDPSVPSSAGAPGGSGSGRRSAARRAPAAFPPSDDDDDFFASLESELSGELSAPSSPSPSTGGGGGGGGGAADDDFFAALEEEMRADLDGGAGGRERATPSEDDGGGDGDFFAALEADLSSELDADVSAPPPPPPAAAAPVAERKAVPPKEEAGPAAAAGGGGGGGQRQEDLSKLTVPVLKDMLRDRGLKVSGRKAELIERLREDAG